MVIASLPDLVLTWVLFLELEETKLLILGFGISPLQASSLRYGCLSMNTQNHQYFELLFSSFESFGILHFRPKIWGHILMAATTCDEIKKNQNLKYSQAKSLRLMMGFEIWKISLLAWVMANTQYPAQGQFLYEKN